MAHSMPESMARVRDKSLPDSELNPSERWRRLILQGEPFNMKGMEQGDVALLSMQKTVLGRLGFTFETTTEPSLRVRTDGKQMPFDLKSYRCTNPGHNPSEADYTAARTTASAMQGKRRKRKPETASTDPVATTGPFDCPLCGSVRKSKDSLRHHLRESHNKKLADVGLSHLPNNPRRPTMGTAPTAAVERHEPGSALDLLSAMNGSYIPMQAPTPAFGGAMQVFALLMDDDGSVKIGVRNGEGKWIAKVEGYVG